MMVKNMMIVDLKYRNIELLKNDLKLIWEIIKERSSIEYEWISKIKNAEKRKSFDKNKYVKRYQGPYNMIFDFFDSRISMICNSLDVLSEKELEYIYDMLICPIRTKEVIEKYDMTSETQCYRHLEKILKRMVEKR